MLEVRLAQTTEEVEAAQRLRYRVFYEEMSATPTPEMRAQRRDFDRFDERCDHLLVVDRAITDEDGQPSVVGTYRLMRDAEAVRAGGFYSAGEYDLTPMLKGLPPGTRHLELGRSCILKEYRTKPGTMQLLWRGVMAYVARFDIDLMFGCASLAGTDADELAMPLSYLYHFHLLPPELRVRALPELFVEMNRLPKTAITPKEALRALPPLIKGYARAGALIGDGAVIDPQFGTTDVFIYLPVENIDRRYRSRFGKTV
ncbi:MAG TPA: GNAT family N-acyltransferase [Rhizomicrobium sp.]|nr:GNAT family N-acyltransferase [Rhizomicrobium sp.]